MTRETEEVAAAKPLLRIILTVGGVLMVLHVAMLILWPPEVIKHLYPWVISLLDSMVILIAACVSFLAFGRYLTLRDPVSYWTGLGFSAVSIGLVFHLIAWPGLFPEGHPLFGTLPSTSAWMSLPAFTLLAVCLLLAPLSRWPNALTLQGRRWLWSLLLWTAAVALGGVGTFLLEKRLPELVSPSGDLSMLAIMWGEVVLVALAAGAFFSARHYCRTGDTLPAYVSFTQIATAFALLMAAHEGNRFGLTFFLDRFVVLTSFLIMIFGLLFEYVRLFRDEREKGIALKMAWHGLEMAKAELERRVAERTAHLEEKQAELEKRNQELLETHRKLEEQVEIATTAMEEAGEKTRMLIEQSRLAAMGELIGNIAHQWRQPLNMLGLLAQEMPLVYESGRFSTEYLDNTVRSILEKIDHLSKTIDNFRDFSRPDGRSVDFMVREAAERAVSLVEGSLAAQGVDITILAEGNPVVHGYPNEFSQVLCNIMINSRDAFVAQEVPTPALTIEVTNQQGWCIVTITDNAGGIPEGVMDKIFDPYFTTKGPTQGTGIALYMSKIIIEKKMAGTLSAANVSGGAQFRIEIPSIEAEECSPSCK